MPQNSTAKISDKTYPKVKWWMTWNIKNTLTNIYLSSFILRRVMHLKLTNNRRLNNIMIWMKYVRTITDSTSFSFTCWFLSWGKKIVNRHEFPRCACLVALAQNSNSFLSVVGLWIFSGSRGEEKNKQYLWPILILHQKTHTSLCIDARHFFIFFFIILYKGPYCIQQQQQQKNDIDDDDDG